MSSNPQSITAERDNRLGRQEWKSDVQDHEKEDYSHAQEAAPPESSTNERTADDDQTDTDSWDEYCDAKEYLSGNEVSDTESSDEQCDKNEHSTNDFHVGHDREEMNEINANLDNEFTEQSHDGLIFSRTEVEQIGKCFKHVVNECSANNSTKDLSSRSGEVLNRSIDMATKMAKGEEVQQAILRQVRSDSSFMRRVNELGEDLDVLRTPPRRRKSSDGGESRKVPWYIRFLDALWRLCHKLCKLGARAINVVVTKIMECFNVGKSIAHKIFKAIQDSLLWIRRAIVDPEGEIKKILDDPEKSNPAKALGVIGVVATAIIGALLLACSIAETGPYGVGVTAIGAVASAMFRRQPSPDHKENSIRSERNREAGSLKSM